MVKLSSAIVQFMWNRSHTCLWALETGSFTKYASLTGAAVCHLASTLSKLHKSTSILLNCCSPWRSSNDTGTPQNYLRLSVQSISKVLSLQATGVLPPAMCQPLQTQTEISKSCSTISFSGITTSNKDHAKQLKSLLHHHDHAASSETAEWQHVKVQEAKRRLQLILSFVHSGGLTRQKAVSAYISNGSQHYEWK